MTDVFNLFFAAVMAGIIAAVAALILAPGKSANKFVAAAFMGLGAFLLIAILGRLFLL